MKEMKGNLFDTITNGIDCICITTNGIVGATGLATMGAGTAGEAARRWPNIRACLGRLLTEHGNRVFLMGVVLNDGSFKDPRINSFNKDDIACAVCSVPTKHDFRFKSNMSLIETSTKQLVKLTDHYKFNKVALSRLGCANGKLSWPDVKNLIEPLLDDRFTVVSFVGEE